MPYPTDVKEPTCQHGGVPNMAKWKRSGVVRLSGSKKVILLGVHGLDPKTWLIVDVDDLFKLIEGKAQEIPIFEAERSP